MEFEKGTSEYFLSDCFGFKDEICIELGKKSIDDITAGDLYKHNIQFKKFLSILNDIKTRNNPANASDNKKIKHKR